MRDAVVQHLGETERSADTGAEMAVGLLVLGCWLFRDLCRGGAQRSPAG